MLMYRFSLISTTSKKVYQGTHEKSNKTIEFDLAVRPGHTTAQKSEPPLANTEAHRTLCLHLSKSSRLLPHHYLLRSLLRPRLCRSGRCLLGTETSNGKFHPLRTRRVLAQRDEPGTPVFHCGLWADGQRGRDLNSNMRTATNSSITSDGSRLYITTPPFSV